ncbi:MAG: HD domain-containing phosphohydrolase, partial [Dehalococcoidia bacterium]
LRFLGFSREEMPGLRLTDMMDESQAPMALALVDKIRRTGRQSGIATFRLRRKDGTYVEVELAAAVVQRDGQPVAIQGVARDVTARKRAEEALRESEERFRSLSASAPIGIFLMDEKGQVLYINERLRVITDAPVEGGPSEELALAVHPDDRQSLLEEWAKADKTGGELSEEYRILTPAKETRWVRMHVSPIFSADGKRSGVVGTVEDITAQKRAGEEMANRLKMESALAQASNLLAGPEDIDAALGPALPILAEAFGAERAVVFVARGKNRVDAVSAWRAPGTEDLRDFDSTTLPWIAGKMIRGEALIVPDVSALPPEAAAEKNAWEPLGIRSLLAVPLASRGRNIGNIMFSNTNGTRVWREEDVKLLRLASESISSFVERRRAGAEKRRAYESIVLLLATAAEARDPYTENHLHRIKNYSEAIALELGLSPEEAQEVGLAALLHDLGKLRVPDSILRKPGPLSEEEWQVMRKHPIWGEEMLPPDPWFRTARQITRWHHENWDGSGYPDGLDSDMIPLAATIVAVADGFDAMTSRRPYKGPWPPIRAMREIVKGRGKRYSPEAVDAFQRAVAKGEIARISAVRQSKVSELTKAA